MIGKTWILMILLNIALFLSPEYAEAQEKDKSWKGAVTEVDLVKAVNFLINNKGKEIYLVGKRHTITGKEELDVVITVLQCCDEKMFLEEISALGKIISVKFPHFYARMPLDTIPQIDKNGEVTEIKFIPESRGFWMNAIKHGLKK
ncbi:MAG: hypothetical protein KJ799_13840 [Bacteroidetes bacterium]|nr:hypothetical protein [Bacteroidota bacterium]